MQNPGLHQAGEDQSNNDAELPLWVYGKRGPSGTLTITEKEAGGYLLKRPCDAVLSLLGLMSAAPLWTVFSLAIKLEARESKV